MYAEDVVVDKCRKTQVVENIRAISSHVQRPRPIFTETFVVKTIYLSNLAAFVVPADQSNAIGVAHLIEGDECNKICLGVCVWLNMPK